MADYKYSKLGYGRAGDVESAIALGLIDGKDIIITKDTSEFMYIRDDLSVQKITSRTLCFDEPSIANEELNRNESTYAGQTVMIKDVKGKYTPWMLSLLIFNLSIFNGPNFNKGGFLWQKLNFRMVLKHGMTH